jgi:hypothetical protein
MGVAQCAMSSGDASLTSFALAMYDRYFHLFTFKFDDRPFLRMIGRADAARKMELVMDGGWAVGVWGPVYWLRLCPTAPLHS